MVIMKMKLLIDIHTHIIPNVDDGARSFDQALAMIEKMANDGIATIIATPHIQKEVTKTSRAEQIEQFELLKTKAQHINVDLILGAEINYLSHIHTNYEEYCLGSSNYILIEFNTDIDTNIAEVAYNINRSGFIPIIAHVERYTYLKNKDYKKIKDCGALLQVNASSVIGERSRYENKVAKYLIKHELMDFVASDTHTMTRRPPNLIEAYNFLNGKIKDSYLEELFYKNALMIVKS